MKYLPNSIDEVQAILRENKHILIRGAGTKPGLSGALDDADVVDVSRLAGMLEYQPNEYVFTAQAGTKISDVNQIINEHGQYLPFDPPIVRRGATLGGTVAAGLSGPGSFHYGGIRDFVMGVRFIDGGGRLVGGGGKVVKNAAGFDLPKLMVGGLGQYGVMVELSFKVFPRPPAFSTIRSFCPDLKLALEALQRASLAGVGLDALDLEPISNGFLLWARVGGPANTLPARMARLQTAIDGGEILEKSSEDQYWQTAREFDWVPSGWSLVKLPITPRMIGDVDQILQELGCLRHYSIGGQVAWLAMPNIPAELHELLLEKSLNALVIWGAPGTPRLGEFRGQGFFNRIRSALDMGSKLGEA